MIGVYVFNHLSLLFTNSLIKSLYGAIMSSTIVAFIDVPPPPSLHGLYV